MSMQVPFHSVQDIKVLLLNSMFTLPGRSEALKTHEALLRLPGEGKDVHETWLFHPAVSQRAWLSTEAIPSSITQQITKVYLFQLGKTPEKKTGI